MFNKAINNYAYAFVPNYYKAQEICDKAANTSPSAVQFFLNFIRPFYAKILS